MERIYEAVTAYLEADGWPYEKIENETVARVLFQGENAQFACFAQAREDQQQFVFYSLCPITIPEHKRPEIAEFITRANYDMVIGNFEMDLDDGEVRFKTSIDVEDTELSPPLLKPLLYANVLMMDQYLPGLMAVIYADKSPVDAIADVEGEQ
jgi:hypothetical protein